MNERELGERMVLLGVYEGRCNALGKANKRVLVNELKKRYKSFSSYTAREIETVLDSIDGSFYFYKIQTDEHFIYFR